MGINSWDYNNGYGDAMSQARRDTAKAVADAKLSSAGDFSPPQRTRLLGRRMPGF